MTAVAVVNGQKREDGPPPVANNNGNQGNALNSQTVQIGQQPRRSEIYRFTSSKPVFASAWSYKSNVKFRLAVGSLVEPQEGNNITLLKLCEQRNELIETASFTHEYPPNKISFIPDAENNYPDLLATTGDILRIWKVDGPDVSLDCTLTNKDTQYSAPLTSFDWNELDPRLIGTSSIDTTCTIFDVDAGTVLGAAKPTTFGIKTQLIAHDKPVHDIAFSKINNGRDHFATVGADGSARMFDLRRLEHSTIVYEDPNKQPLMRLAWNKQEAYYMATYAQDATEVIILDIRMPCHVLTKLRNHTAAVNGIAWAPHSPHHICTAGDDAQALIWDLQHVPRPVDDPILAYSSSGEVNQVIWGPVHHNWICICFNKTLEILRV